MSSKQSTKLVHALKSPFSKSPWPIVSSETETAILDLLLPLIEPIGQYRKTNIVKSKGRKRQKKDARKIDPKFTEPRSVKRGTAIELPTIQKYLKLGFNSSVRCLELLAQEAPFDKLQVSEDEDQRALCAVLVCASVLPSVMSEPLPYLIAAASKSLQLRESVRLVSISPTAASKIAQALALPRAHVVGIAENTPGGEELQRLIRTSISSVDVPWSQESKRGVYRPVQVASKEVVVATVNAKGGKRKRGTEDSV